MIDIKKLTPADVGRWVRYLSFQMCDEPEYGRIKSWNERFIFVVYKCNEEWERYQDFTGQATDPYDLTFMEDVEKIK